MTSVSRNGAVACHVTIPPPPPTSSFPAHFPSLSFPFCPLPSPLPPSPPCPPFTPPVCAVLQQGNLKIDTEFGKIEAGPGEIVVIQVRGEVMEREREEMEGKGEGEKRDGGNKGRSDGEGKAELG